MNDQLSKEIGGKISEFQREFVRSVILHWERFSMMSVKAMV